MKLLLLLVLCDLCTVSHSGNFVRSLPNDLRSSRGFSSWKGTIRRWSIRSFSIRGGSDFSEDDEQDDESDVFDASGDDDDFDISAGDFEGEDTPLRRLQSAVSRTPPITQGFLSLSIVITVGAWLLNKNMWPKFLSLDWPKVTTRFQIWRLFTSFLYFGPLDLSYGLTLQFVWQYMSQLEKVHFSEPEQFVLMLAVGATLLLAMFGFTGMPTTSLGHNLACYFVYVWARTFEGHDVNFMDLFTIRSELMPWFLALQTLLLEGEVPYMDLFGIFIGHIYYVLHAYKKLPCPGFLKRMMRENDFLQRRYAAVGEDFGEAYGN